MTITTRPNRQLSLAEKDVVINALASTWKVYAVALAVLRVDELCETGALALVRDNEQLALLLINFSGVFLWKYLLAEYSKLERIPGSERHYLLTNADRSIGVSIVFANDEEVSKLVIKFDKARKRLAACKSLSSRGLSSASSLPNQLRRLHLSGEIGAGGVVNEEHPCTGQTSRLQFRFETRSLRPSPSQAYVEGDQEMGSRSHSAPSAPCHYVDLVGDSSGSQDRVSNGHSSASSFTPLRLILHPPPNESVLLNSGHSAVSFSDTRSTTGTLAVPGADRARHNASLAVELEGASLTPRSSSKGPKTWTTTIRNKTYEVPDVTSELTIVDAREGEGGFGIVRQGMLRGKRVAVKAIRLSPSLNFFGKIVMKDSKEAVMGVICHNLRHANIMPFHGIATSEQHGACLVSPWMKNKDSLSFIRLEENKAVLRIPIIYGACRGLAYLHKKGITHGDIKAQNVLISDDGTPLLCDFGLASCCGEWDRQDMSKSLQHAGNVRWKAYELLYEEKPGCKVTKETDMWAFAMFAVEMLTGDVPFPGKSSPSIIIAIEQDDTPSRPAASECSDELWGLIGKCWTKEPSGRPIAEEAVKILGQMVDRA